MENKEIKQLLLESAKKLSTVFEVMGEQHTNFYELGLTDEEDRFLQDSLGWSTSTADCSGIKAMLGIWGDY